MRNRLVDRFTSRDRAFLAAWPAFGCSLLLLGTCAKVKSSASDDAAASVDGAHKDGTAVLDLAPPIKQSDGPTPLPIDTASPDSASELACGEKTRGSAGCSFYAAEPYLPAGGGCYALFVVNPGTRPVKLTLDRAGTPFSLEKTARLPRGAGLNLTFQPYDPVAGLAPRDVAILFLSGSTDAVPRQIHGPVATRTPACPYGTEPAVTQQTSTVGSGLGQAFHLTSDHPVVAYDVNPYGGAFSYVTSSSLLLPEEAWSRSNLIATPIHQEQSPQTPVLFTDDTYAMIIASQDGTDVAVRPPMATVAGTGVPAGAASQVFHIKLNAGQYAQVIEQRATNRYAFSIGMSGTAISADKPVAVLGGSPCIYIPPDSGACDSVHQQIAPFSAWGHEYAAVRYRGRIAAIDEPVPWLMVGAVDGTVLSYAPKAPAIYTGYPTAVPTTLAAGQVVQFWTAQPFVVKSQDADHPFYVGSFMTGGLFLRDRRTAAELYAGDPEFVNVVPTDQYLSDYTFFTDPTYSETNLVVVRKPGADGAFADVKLACAAGPVSNWTPIGGLQFARVDLVTGDYHPVIPGCDNGVQRMTSAAPFSVTVWGWGTKLSGGLDVGTVSYGYPAGTGLRAVTSVVPIVIP
jgi:hypothetical protein